jgi:hypothetical protein
LTGIFGELCQGAGFQQQERIMARLTGGCLCGAVRYEITGAEQIALSCHCRDCQYIAGGAPSHAMVVLSKDLTVTKGEAEEYWSLSARGNRVARLFCGRCGTPLFGKNEKHLQYLAVKPGSLDDPSGFRPQANIWTQSAQPWHHLDAAMPRFKRNPEFGIKAILEFARAAGVRLGRFVRGIKFRRPQEEGPGTGET